MKIKCSPANPRLPMVADMEKSWQMLTMVIQKDQDAVNNCYQPRGRNFLSLFVILFEKWYNYCICLFENQSFDNRTREKSKR